MTELRAFAPGDFDAAMSIERELFPRDAWSPEVLRSELALVGESREYWVAVDGDEVVGYCGLYYLPPDSDVQTIAVKASHQRRGVGSLMLRTMVDTAIAKGCKHMMLEVAVENTGAMSLYERFGFRALGVRRNYYGPGLDCVVMECADLSEVSRG